MASILKRGDSYSVRFKYKDHSGRICDCLLYTSDAADE